MIENDNPLRELRQLPTSVQWARAKQARRDTLLEAQLLPNVEAHQTASRFVLDELRDKHRYLSESTDLELAGPTRASAIWLMSGRCIGLAESLWVLVNAGIANESMVIGRSVHEAARVLRTFRQLGEDELLEL